MTAGYTMPTEWDEDDGTHAVASVVPLSVRNKAQQLIVARDEREASKRGLARTMSATTAVNHAEKAAKARHLETVNEWLASKEVLPKHVVDFDRPRRR
jgi:hypothetical protein